MAIETNEIIDVKTLPPFKKFIMSIGAIPTSYLETMSYAELLMWFCNYLQETVIPTVNNNAEALQEMITYLENLDLQDYVDNKLDEMVEDGTMQALIDGYTTIPELTSRVGTLEDKVEDLEIANDGKVIFIGDSYLALYENNNWAKKLASKLGLTSGNYYAYGEGGSGFNKSGNSGHTFLTLLQAHSSDIADHNAVSKIIVGGGYNDQESASVNALATTISNFCTYCKTNYPNATVYASAFGWTMKPNYISVRNNINNIVIPAYKMIHNYGGVYLANTELCFRDYYLYDSGENQVHPSVDGEEVIANALYDALHNGYTVESRFSTFTIPTSDTISSSNLKLDDRLNNGRHTISLIGSINVSISYGGSGGITVALGEYTGNLIRKSTNQLSYLGTINIRLTNTSSQTIWVTGNVVFDTSGNLQLIIDGGQLSSSMTINSIILNTVFVADGYIW